MKWCAIFISCVVLITSQACGAEAMRSQQLFVEGHAIELQVVNDMTVQFVASISGPAPRFISKGPQGEFIIGSRGATLYRMRPPYANVERLVDLGSGFVHSAAFKQGRLYAAETEAVWSAPYGGVNTHLLQTDFSRDVSLPSSTGGHSSRTIVTGPDERLYVGLGISGNCSDEYLHPSYPFERRRGGVFLLENKTLIPFSSGLRNPIGLAFQPATEKLFATNAGPDNLGYDLPPEILAPLSQGSYHGMPWFQYYNGGFNSGQCATSDPPLGKEQATPPAAFFPARSTPEGIFFLQNSSLGSEYDGSAAVAIHGSWATQPGQGPESRRPPKLSVVNFSGVSAVGVADLVTGFQRSDGSRFARPCGVMQGDDGHLYFSSDGGEVTGIFRIVPKNRSTSTVSSVISVLFDKD